jgi:hypothetical protein
MMSALAKWQTLHVHASEGRQTEGITDRCLTLIQKTTKRLNQPSTHPKQKPTLNN